MATRLSGLVRSSRRPVISNTAVGRLAGQSITTGSNIIAIGLQVAGVSTAFGEVDDSCYIDNIFGADVDLGTVTIVGVDADGKLGTNAVDAAGNSRCCSWAASIKPCSMS